MKMARFFLLMAVLVIASAANATEVFETFNGFTQSSYGNYDYNGFHIQNGICDAATGTGNPLPSNAVRIRNQATSYLEYVGSDGMGKDGGVGVISFLYRSWDATAAQCSVMVSVNGGAYTRIGALINTTSTTYLTWTYTLNNTSDNIKIKIQRIGTTRQMHVEDFRITDYAMPTGEADARLQAGGIGAQPTISSLLVTETQAQTVLTFQVRDEGTGAYHFPAWIRNFTVNQAAGNTATDWAAYIAGAKLTDGTNVWTGTVAAANISFSGEYLTTLPDGGAWQTWSLSIWLKTTLPYNADNKVLDFIVAPTSFGTDTAGAAFNPADPTLESGVANNRVTIVATQLGITTQPAAIINANTNFTVRAGFTDIYGGIDQDWPAEAIALALANGSGTLSAVSGLEKVSAAGQSQWTDLRYNQAETGVRIQAVSESFPDPVPTSFFDVWLESSIAIDAYPQYWDGTADSTAVPFAVHVTVANWITGANQDVYLKVYSGSNNPYHYTPAFGWSNSTAYIDVKPIVHLDDHGSWSGWLPLKSKGMATFQPRVALVTATGTNFTGAAITGTLLNIAPAGNGAIIENRTTGNVRPGYIVLVRNAANVITGLWIAEDNGYPMDDGGTPIPERGYRFASLAFCEQATFESWAPESWPGHGTAFKTEVKPDWCAQPGEIKAAEDVILPVELLGNVVATAGDASVTLSWATASENNNVRFDVVRNGRVVGRVDGAGSSNTRHNYSWTESELVNGNAYSYTLRSVDVNGAGFDIATVSATPAAGALVITEYALAQNYPNPFNPTTSISFDLVDAGHVNLMVYNLMGQNVASLVNAPMTAGRHIVSFDANALPSGVYFYRLNVNGFVAEKKMLLMK
jgi:hypothetical protein